MAQEVQGEFARQVAVMKAAGYPRLAGLTDDGFDALVQPLRGCLDAFGDEGLGGGPHTDGTDGRHAPWLIVVSDALIRAEDLVPLLRLPGGTRPGVVDRNHGDDPLAEYRPIPEVAVPDAPVYLVCDVDRGDEFRSVRPRDAVPEILARGRTPLTIHEGIALALLRPAALEPNHCFMLAASRRGDRRVPALWISARAPKLGWCWEGNHHTWLGIASAGSRHAPADAGPVRPGVSS